MIAETVCAVCGGTGWKIVERAGLSGAQRCECFGAERPAHLLKRANIPPKYDDATLDNFQIPQDNPIARHQLGTVLMQVKSFVREYPTKDHPGLLLVGGNGTGKTRFAVGALKALIERGFEGVFFDYQSLLERISKSWDVAGGTGDRAAYRSAFDTEVLVLDELGAHRPLDWIEDVVTGIITHRCNNWKPLIVTTNLPDPDITGYLTAYKTSSGMAIQQKCLADVIGARARSRLFELCRIVRMPDLQDYRVQHREDFKDKQPR
jgi:DNA replication protein DnaC